MKKATAPKVAKKVLKHIKKDDAEFRGQIADDKKLAKALRKVAKPIKAKK